MQKIISYRDLECWQQAMDLTIFVYGVTRNYPKYELFGLTAHTRLIDALAEHAELETQMMVAQRLQYIGNDDMTAFMNLSGSVGRLTHGLLRSLDPLH